MDATEQLLEIAEKYRQTDAVEEKAAAEWRSLPIRERITHALVKGIDAYVDRGHRGAARRDLRPPAVARSR